ADLYFRTTQSGETAWLEPDMEAKVRALPQIERVAFLRSTRVALDAAKPPVALLARDLEQIRVPTMGRTYERKPSDPPGAWISEPVADLYGLSPGSRIELPLKEKKIPFVVEGVWRDYARQFGAIVIDRHVYADLSGDRRSNDAAVWLKPG